MSNTNTPFWSKNEADNRFYSLSQGKQLENTVANIADGTGGKSYPDIDTAMAVNPLPNDNVLFSVDENNIEETGVYAYDSTQPGGYRWVRGFASGEVAADNPNAVSGGEVFKKTIKPEDINKQVISSLNLFNPVNIIQDRYISTTVDLGLQVGAGWQTAWAEVGANNEFAISGWDSARTEIGFFSGVPSSANKVKTGPANLIGYSKSGNTLIGTMYPGSTHIAITAKNATETNAVYSKLQIELGNTVTPYQPYGSTSFVSAIQGDQIAVDKVIINGQAVDVSFLQLKGPELETEFTYDNSIAVLYSSMTFNYQGKTIFQRFKTKRQVTLDAANTFDWNLFQINGVTKHSQADENAPYRINSWTVGGNHGYRRYNITQTAHGKTTVDIGSVWTDSTNQWVIVGIVSPDVIAVSHRTDNSTALTANILTHVSGAANTTSINSTTKTSVDFYPPNKNYSLMTYVDNMEVTENIVYTGKKALTFIESYDILLKSSIMDWFVANVGNVIVPTQPDGVSIARVTNTYSFDTNMMCHTQQTFQALTDVELPFQDIMFLMANKLSVPYGAYVPKSIPFTQGADSYDFRMPMTYTTPTSYRIDFTPNRYEKWGRIPDRVMHIATGENLGFVVGFLPVQNGETEIRKKLASRKSMQFQESGKIYMSGVDSADITTFKKGDVYQIQGYKGYFFKEGVRTANYVVDTPQGKYYYYDWHVSTSETLNLPESYTLIEQSPNVTILNGKVTVKIDTDNVYGFLIIKE